MSDSFLRFRPQDWVRSWPFFALGLLTVLFIFMLLFSRKAPVIESLDPPMASPGQQVTISGDYFGRTEREGTLNLAGEIPPPSLIKSWTDQKIVFVVPEDASSGLVTVSNSQGTSQGVLFTNTLSIPTVLQAAGAPGVPLVTSVVPGAPVAGQTVTLSGRGFGDGEDSSFVRLITSANGPLLEIGPSDSQDWTDRSLSFRWPAGAGIATTVQIVGPRGESGAFPVAGSGPVTFGAPRAITVELRASFTQSAAKAVNLWGPVPEREALTSWTLVSAEPAPASGSRPLVFSWPSGSAGERAVVYKLSLKSWSRQWDGPPAGPVPTGVDVPAADPRPSLWWKGSGPTLKALTAKWGLDSPDPWTKVQRIQAGLSGSFRFDLEATSVPGDRRPAAAALASGVLGSAEASSLAAFLAGQSGVPCRLVSGLWKAPSGALQTRVWTEFWMAGAGWVSWDPIDGEPGNLDNRHFAFEAGAPSLDRWLARSQLVGPDQPGTLGKPSGETSGTGSEPIVRWQVTEAEK